ncbi:MAG: Spy/CpxP family protein refolding chaperone [Candidatus Fermentibacter sp.]|nr:Spy/CpxP family protein refolding chaperone [Candidatus Fermentibacter sp.]
MRGTVLAAVIAMAVPSVFTGSRAFAQPPSSGGCGAGTWAPVPGGGPGCGGAGPGSGPGMGGVAIEALMPVLGGLDLDDAQRGSIDAILEETREEIRSLMDEEAPVDPMAGFMEVFGSPEITVDDLEALAEEMAGRREAAREIELEAIVRIHDVLTPEQLSTIGSLPVHGGGAAPCGRSGSHDRG